MRRYFLICLKNQFRSTFKRRGPSYGCYSHKNTTICAPTNSRFYLSPAYRCEDIWNNRFEDPLLKNVKPIEFYYELLKKHKNEGKLSSVDADIFLNSLNEGAATSLREEIEETLHLLRRSPETINTLESTPHATVRLLIETKQYDLLLKILSDPMNYGVFLDYYTASLAMDTFIKERNFMAAARAASMLMLEEDFGPPLTQAYVLLSSLKYVFNEEENEPWVDYNPNVEPEEEVKILVKYVRNPYFDDHFDLKDPLHIVGKTLAWLAFHLEDPTLKANASILGWSLYEKWSDLLQSLEEVIHKKIEIDEIVLSKVSSQIERCADHEMKSKLMYFAEKIKQDGPAAGKLSIIEKSEEFVKSASKNYENEFIEIQEKHYIEWAKKRNEEVQHQLEMFERRRLLQEIEEKKEDLARREEVIFFFENEDKLELMIDKNEMEAAKIEKSKSEKKEIIIDDYIPPEV